MKIVDIKFTRGVEPLGRRNVQLPLVKAARDVAVAGIIGSAAEAAAGISHTMLKQKAESRQELYKEQERQIKIIEDRQTLMDTENAQTGYLEGNSVLAEKHSGIQEYSPEDVGMEGDKPIAAYEVQPKLFREERIKLMEEHASTIRNPEAAARFRGNTQQYIEQQYARDVAKSAGIQHTVHRKNQIDNINRMEGKGNYAAAREMAKNFEGTQEEKNALIFGIDKQEEEDEMNLAIAQKDVVSMDIFAKDMKQDPEKYDGTLTQAERTAWAGKLDRAIYQTQEQERATSAVYKKAVNKMGKQMLDGLYNGYDLPQDRVNAVIAKVKDVNPILAVDIARAATHQDVAARVAWVSPSARTTFIEATRDKVTNEVQADDHRHMEDAVKQMNTEQADDSATFGYKRGLTDQVNLDLSNLPESLAALNKNDNILRANIGLTTGIFTKDQAREFAKAISVMTPAQLLTVFASTEDALGDEANKVYEQLKAEGLSDTLAVAGQIYVDGDIIAAEQVIEGRRIRQSYPKMFATVEKDLDLAIDLELGSMYKDKQGQHELMRQAIKDIIATKLGDDVRPDSIDDAILSGAVQQVTGGRIMANHMSIVPPERGMPQSVWDEYVDDMKLSTLGRMGQPLNMTLGELRDDIHSEKIQFKSAGENEYYLFHEPSNDFVRDKNTGGVFIFKYMNVVEADEKSAYELKPEFGVNAEKAVIKKKQEEMLSSYLETLSQAKISAEQPIAEVKDLLKKAGKTAGQIGDFLQTPLGELLEKGKVDPKKIPKVILPKVKSRLAERAGQIGDWLNKPISDFF